MKRQHIAQLEQHLESLIEGAFSNIFGRKPRPNDVALQIARAMEDNLRPAEGNDARPIAPDQYSITVAPEIYKRLFETQPDIQQKLTQHLNELAHQANYRLLRNPVIKLLANSALETSNMQINALHTDTTSHSTAAMQRVTIPAHTKPINAQLLIGSGDNFELGTAIVNIGRHHDNDIVLSDPTASRHHVQLRLRNGRYILFDLNSRSGTYVNNIPVLEHQLRPGDIITTGQTRILYLEDDDEPDTNNSKTDAFDPIEDN